MQQDLGPAKALRQRAGLVDFDIRCFRTNDLDFECKEGVVKAWLNGVLVNEAKCQASEGYIGIQSEGGPIEFRNIYLTKVR